MAAVAAAARCPDALEKNVEGEAVAVIGAAPAGEDVDLREGGEEVGGVEDALRVRRLGEGEREDDEEGPENSGSGEEARGSLEVRSRNEGSASSCENVTSASQWQRVPGCPFGAPFLFYRPTVTLLLKCRPSWNQISQLGLHLSPLQAVCRTG